MRKRKGGDEQQFGRPWIAEASLMLAVFGIGLAVSIYLFEKANTPLPQSNFEGSLGVDAAELEGIDFAYPDATVYIRYGEDSPTGIRELAMARNIDLVLSGGEMRYFLGKTIVISASEDAVLSGVDVTVNRGRSASSKMEPSIESIWDQGSTQKVSFTVPLTYQDIEFISITGRMSKPVGIMSGDITDAGFPVCYTGPPFSGCSVDAGRISADESVTYASISLKDPLGLHWDDTVSAVYPHVRITDEAIGRQQNSYVFIAGAAIGIAANATIELLLLLARPTGYRRRISPLRLPYHKRPKKPTYIGMMSWHPNKAPSEVEPPKVESAPEKDSSDNDDGEGSTGPPKDPRSPAT